MKKSIKTVHTLQAPVQELWSLIESGKDWERWFDLIGDSSVDGNIRFCNLVSGEQLEELFLSNAGEKTFLYSIEQQNIMPATNLVGIIRLEEIDESTTKLYWSLDLEVESEEVFDSFKDMPIAAYTAAAAKLEQIALETATV